MKLKASEVRFWQEVYLAFVQSGPHIQGAAFEWADKAVERLRERIEVVEPIPGRL